MSHPFILGLTGSIGMGKSTVAEMFRELGVPVFDADAQVHKLQGPGGACVSAIERVFPGTTGADGVDRAELGHRVFGNSAALARLEAIIHPAVHVKREEFLFEHAGQPLVVFDVPLLFEKGGDKNVDAVAVVSADAGIQRRRVLARQGMTPERFAEILSMQMPDEEKREKADYLIDTGCSLTQTKEIVANLVQSLTG
ncbi:dephospho-CoA kinase [Altericroceibacterium spongiae]|uniref:Dephospho-CoA kinase n=1 Tax=Altericroceibacterium spongiae TaxID=2320269 RepID=A0A420EEG4_9SPHN|nr:dephospho-CoA kinase [Altericroceibacterium spongiae]RKF19046.1 dephospho-CoA kinase [Altericroceibacterium spongiae]